MLPFLLIVASCTQVQGPNPMNAIPGSPKTSPSGHLQLQVREFGGNHIPFQSFDIVRLGDMKLLYSCPDSFFMRHTTFFLWDDHDDRVWAYSGDVGTSYWEETGIAASADSLGEWRKHDYVRNGRRPPRFLIDYWPEYFK